MFAIAAIAVESVFDIAAKAVVAVAVAVDAVDDCDCEQDPEVDLTAPANEDDCSHDD